MPGLGERLLPFLARHWGRLLLSAFLLVVFFGNQGFRSLARNWLELRHLTREIEALEKEQSRLAGRLKTPKAGDFALERAARKELGFVKPGEIEYRFPPPSPQKE